MSFNTRKLKKAANPYLLVAPMMIAIGVVVLWPIARIAWMSFFDIRLSRPGSAPFVGLENYFDVMASSDFRNTLRTTLIYAGVTIPIRLGLGLWLALLLNRAFRGRAAVRAIFLVPWALPVVITGLLWIWILQTESGILNYFLVESGILDQAVPFLGSRDTALLFVMGVNIWKGTPFVAIMFLAALQTVPAELLEAAEVDGASYRQRLFQVVLPLIRPVTIFVSVLLVIWTLRDFDLVFVLTQGGPARATELFTLYVYTTAFKGLRIGEASAAGMILLLISFSVAYLLTRLNREST